MNVRVGGDRPWWVLEMNGSLPLGGVRGGCTVTLVDVRGQW